MPLVDLAFVSIGEMRYTPWYAHLRDVLCRRVVDVSKYDNANPYMVYTVAASEQRQLLERIAVHSAWPVQPYSLNSNSDLYSNHVCALSHPGNIQVAQIVSEARLAYAIDHVYKVDVPRYNIRTSLFLEGCSRPFSRLR